MSVTEFCQRILFSPRLEDKLADPEDLLEEGPLYKGDFPNYPARQQSFAFGRTHKVKAPFPKIGELDNPHSRGVVFHFFANHELLALELMALALLRFPDAPRGFRRGILGTMQEEQRHLKMYLSSMNKFGVGFGDIPVNDFFWHCLSEMKTPQDYITGMSLTFEQANLDFAAYYRDVFRKIGDSESADIMDIVYREEIGHVKSGLNWFEELRPGDESLFDEYKNSLAPPLSPSRAKGKVFRVDARLAAGFDNNFIESLKLFSDDKYSRGRFLWVNTDAEVELSSIGGSYSPSKMNRSRMDDLAPLACLWARPGDSVICNRAPSKKYLLSLDKMGFVIPTFIPPSQQPSGSQLVAWGWTERCLDLLSHKEDGELKTRHFRSLSSKLKCLDLRSYLRESCGSQICFGVELVDGIVGRSMDQILRYRDRVFETFGFDSCIKSKYGAAGQGLVRIQPGDIPDNQAGWIQKQLEKYGEVLVEAWLPRLADFSIQLEVGSKVNHKLTRPLCDQRGQYLGHVLGKNNLMMSKSLAKVVRSSSQGLSVWEQMEIVGKSAGEWLKLQGFSGQACVDLFVYKGAGDIHLHVSEINPRMSMGYVATQVQKKLVYGVTGLFLILSSKFLSDSGYSSFEALHQDWSSRFPVVYDNKLQRIQEGVVFFSDPGMVQQTLPVAIVGSSILEKMRGSLAKIFSLVDKEI